MTRADFDAMSGRKLRARWVVRGMLRLETAMHLGGEATEYINRTVLRDPREGVPLLPGTTLAGALRNALADRVWGYGKEGPEGGAADAVSLLFGGRRGDDDGLQSPLMVFDARGELPEGSSIEIRDGVAIDPKTGTAEDGKKYDYEVLPAGTEFPVRVDLLVPAEADEAALLKALATALDALSHGETAFGAKRSRGLGRVSATWCAKRYDFTSREGWLQWAGWDDGTWNKHTRDDGQSTIDGTDLSKPLKALNAAATDVLGDAPLSLHDDRRRRVMIDLDLSVVGDILVRSPSTDPGAPDVSHLTSGGGPILPGTSLAGVMRARALRIAKLVRDKHGDAQHWIDRLFGPRFEGQHPPPDQQARASRVRMGESVLKNSTSRRQTRVAIDRFTQGTVAGALFEEQTQAGGTAQIRIELRRPEEGELGLLLLVLKDLLDGQLPVGGTSSVGRGRLKGTAEVTFHEGNGKKPCAATLEPGCPPAGDGADRVIQAIKNFHVAQPLANNSDTNPPAHSAGGTP